MDDSQFEVLKDANKTLGWFIDHAENPDLANDPDFDSGVSLVYVKGDDFPRQRILTRKL